jgi:hypothetical protein
MFKEAAVRLRALLLNADKAFSANSLRQVCMQRDITANIPRNRHSAD